ncbi:MAG: hypothetical protein ACYTEZ_05255 [Planctomycetota bacterium]|jgi:hypothetical protein
MNRAILLLLGLFVTVGCQSGGSTEPPPSESNLTPGMAKRHILKDRTTQAEIMEIFGPPDLVTHKDDLQVWTYDKIRYDIERTSGGLAVVVGGGGGGVGAGGGGHYSKSRTRSSSTSTMLIIYFDAKDIVRDYRMQVTRF